MRGDWMKKKLSIRNIPDGYIVVVVYILVAIIISNTGELVDFLSSNKLNLDVISDLVTVSGVTLGILFPLSLEIISRISNKYQSDNIVKQLSKHRKYKSTWYSIIFVIMIILFKVFMPTGTTSHDILVSNLLLLLSIILFLGVIYLLFNFYLFFSRYLGTSEQILNDYEDIIRNQMLTLNTIDNEFNSLNSNLISLKEVLSSEIKRGNYVEVKRRVKTLNNIFMSKLKRTREFEEEYYNLFIVETECEILDNYKYIDNKFDELSVLYSSILLELNSVSLSLGNNDLSLYLTQRNSHFLTQLTKSKYMSNAISKILDIMFYEFAKYKNEPYTFKYRIAYDWYMKYLSSVVESNITIHDYWNHYSKYYKYHLEHIISNGVTDVFEGLVDSMHHFTILGSNMNSLSQISSKMIRIDIDRFRRFDEKYNSRGITKDIDAMSSSIYSIDKLTGLINSINDYKVKVIELFPELDTEVDEIIFKYLKKVKEKIIENEMKKMGFHIIIYSLFSNKFSYINYLINFKQPDDSETTWVGHDIVFKTPESLFKQDVNGGFYEFHKGHHDARIYIKRAILLMLYIFKIKYGQKIDLLNLNGFTINEIDKLMNLCDQLIKHNSGDIVSGYVEKYFALENDLLHDVISNMNDILSGYKTQIIKKKNRVIIDSAVSNTKKEKLKEVLSSAYYCEHASIDIELSTRKFKKYDCADHCLNIHLTKDDFIEGYFDYDFGMMTDVGKQMKVGLIKYASEIMCKNKKVYKSLRDAIERVYKDSKFEDLRIFIVNSRKNEIETKKNKGELPHEIVEYISYDDTFIPVERITNKSDSTNRIILFSQVDSPFRISSNKPHLEYNFSNPYYKESETSSKPIDIFREELLDNGTDITRKIFITLEFKIKRSMTCEMFKSVTVEGVDWPVA